MLHHLLAILLVVTAGVFGPLTAAATMPDPTWIGGMYDDGDSDALVALVWELAPAVVPAPLVVLAPTQAASSVRPVVVVARTVAAVASVSRAPPLA